ncbi:Uncharacterised protein [Serratia quinivorans]|nr:Uncharacterised protein [Serratia quinivorans]
MSAYNIKGAILSGISGILTILLINSSELTITPSEFNYIQFIIIISTFLGIRSFIFTLINIYHWHAGNKRTRKSLH